MKAELVSIDSLIPDPHNPRVNYLPDRKAELMASIQVHGIKVPLIGYIVPEGIMVGDGHCRLAAARQLGLKEVPVIIFAQKPSEAELLITQLTINGHRHALNPVDEYEAFSRLAKLMGWNASQLATNLAVSNAEITRVQAIAKLTPEERQLVRDGKLSKSAAYALSRMTGDERASFARQAAAGEITRDELNSHVSKKKANATIRTSRLSCPIKGGTVSVQASEGLNINGLIEMIETLLREFRRARTQGLDLSTTVRLLRERNRPHSAS